MKRILLLFLTLLGTLLCGEAFAQRVTNAHYQTVAHIKPGGTIQDANYRTISHAPGIPLFWAAWYFFFD